MIFKYLYSQVSHCSIYFGVAIEEFDHLQREAGWQASPTLGLFPEVAPIGRLQFWERG